MGITADGPSPVDLASIDTDSVDPDVDDPFEAPFENMVAFATGGEVGRFVRADGELISVYSHGVTRAAVTVLVYAAVAVTIAALVFRRRDVD